MWAILFAVPAVTTSLCVGQHVGPRRSRGVCRIKLGKSKRGPVVEIVSSWSQFDWFSNISTPHPASAAIVSESWEIDSNIECGLVQAAPPGTRKAAVLERLKRPAPATGSSEEVAARLEDVAEAILLACGASTAADPALVDVVGPGFSLGVAGTCLYSIGGPLRPFGQCRLSSQQDIDAFPWGVVIVHITLWCAAGWRFIRVVTLGSGRVGSVALRFTPVIDRHVNM